MHPENACNVHLTSTRKQVLAHHAHYRAWNNADDGWDFYNNVTNGVVLTNCWAFKNGVDLWNLGSGFKGNGNGFKLGGAGTRALRRGRSPPK